MLGTRQRLRPSRGANAIFSDQRPGELVHPMGPLGGPHSSQSIDSLNPNEPSRVNCPFCNSNNDKVIDSREADAGKVVRRRRECVACERRFTTYERVEQTARLMVIKRDGTHVAFNRDNIMRGVQAACGKRPIPEERKQAVVDQIEEQLHQEFDREVASSVIGERVMAKLRDLDDVAYIRYASEHHQFKSVDDLRAELDALEQRTRDVKDQQPLFSAPPPPKKPGKN